MTKDEAIERIFKTGILKKICRQIADPSFSDDLEQEIYVAMLRKPEPLLQELWDKGQMHFYLTRVATNLYRSSTSKFTKKHKQFEHNDDVSTISDMYYAENSDPEQIEQIMIASKKIISSWDKPNEFPYLQQLFLLYLQSPSMAEISRLTGIPYRTVKKTINELKQKLKNDERISDFFDN